jgi:hypothetical protein
MYVRYLCFETICALDQETGMYPLETQHDITYICIPWKKEIQTYMYNVVVNYIQ